MSNPLPKNWSDRTNQYDDWTEEETELLIALRRHKVSAAKISRILGTRSRCAVISKWTRLGLTDTEYLQEQAA